jgi:hypothetical protein
MAGEIEHDDVVGLRKGQEPPQGTREFTLGGSLIQQQTHAVGREQPARPRQQLVMEFLSVSVGVPQ